jgi:hypothetical protein
MSPQNTLIPASIVFAVLWTALMYIWNAPGFTGAIALAFSGALAGVLWYFGMRWYLNRFVTRQ